MLHPTAIPMFVDDDTESGIESVIHNLLDTKHPSRVYCHILLVYNMTSHPRGGNAKAVKSLLLQALDITLRCLVILPGSLRLQAGVVGKDIIPITSLHRITKIDTWRHIMRQLGCSKFHLRHTSISRCHLCTSPCKLGNCRQNHNYFFHVNYINCYSFM